LALRDVRTPPRCRRCAGLAVDMHSWGCAGAALVHFRVELAPNRHRNHDVCANLHLRGSAETTAGGAGKTTLAPQVGWFLVRVHLWRRSCGLRGAEVAPVPPETRHIFQTPWACVVSPHMGPGPWSRRPGRGGAHAPSPPSPPPPSIRPRPRLAVLMSAGVCGSGPGAFWARDRDKWTSDPCSMPMISP
jgi:hypothetical protein